MSRLLRPACPRRVLAGFYPRSGIFLAPWRRGGIVRYDLFDLNGFPRRGDRRRPRVRHLVLYASRHSLIERGAPFSDWPVGAKPFGLRNGLTRRPRLAPPRLLVRARWAGRRGELVLERPYPNGGVDGNHVVFRWRQGGIEYAASLHEWEPFRQAVATLHAIVRSMPRP